MYVYILYLYRSVINKVDRTIRRTFEILRKHVDVKFKVLKGTFEVLYGKYFLKKMLYNKYQDILYASYLFKYLLWTATLLLTIILIIIFICKLLYFKFIVLSEFICYY